MPQRSIPRKHNKFKLSSTHSLHSEVSYLSHSFSIFIHSFFVLFLQNLSNLYLYLHFCFIFRFLRIFPSMQTLLITQFKSISIRSSQPPVFISLLNLYFSYSQCLILLPFSKFLNSHNQRSQTIIFPESRFMCMIMVHKYMNN